MIASMRRSMWWSTALGLIALVWTGRYALRIFGVRLPGSDAHFPGGSEMQQVAVLLAIVLCAACLLVGPDPDLSRRAYLGSVILMLPVMVVTYPIIGLALFVPVLLLLAARIAVDGDPAGSKVTGAWIAIVLAAVLMPVSLFDPGSSAVVILPLGMFVLAWGIRTVRRVRAAN
jgi:hypothetical protein